jgi:hypothetical protein
MPGGSPKDLSVPPRSAAGGETRLLARPACPGAILTRLPPTCIGKRHLSAASVALVLPPICKAASTLRNTGGTDHESFDSVGIPGFQCMQDPVE